MKTKLIKRKPIVRQLAEVLGGTWRAVRYGFGWKWECDDGREVNAYSELPPGSDDDDAAITVYEDNHGNRIGSEGLIYRNPSRRHR